MEIEKQKLLNKGKDKAKDFIGELITKNQKATDSTKQENQETTKDVIGGLLGGVSKNVDSTKGADSANLSKKETQTEVAKKILGGLFGKKQEEETTKEDSIQ